jgi:hypothetical protein
VVKRGLFFSDSVITKPKRQRQTRGDAGAQSQGPRAGQPSYRTGRNSATPASSRIRLCCCARGYLLLRSAGLCRWAVLEAQANGDRVPTQDEQGARIAWQTAPRSPALQGRPRSHARHDAPEPVVPFELLAALPPGHQLDTARRERRLRFDRRFSSSSLYGIAYAPRQHSARTVSPCGHRGETQKRAHVGHGDLPSPFESRYEAADADLLRHASPQEE